MVSNIIRNGRMSLPNYAYHLTICTHNKQNFFENFTCARIVIREIKTLTNKGDVNTLAWVVMPDHLHWLVQLNKNTKLKNITKNLKGRSANLINKTLNRTGAIWQRGYHDHAIRNETQFIGTARYIVANPLRAKLVTNIGNYPHWDAIWLE